MDALTLYQQRLKQSERYCEGHWDRAIDNYSHYLGRLSLPKRTFESEEEQISKQYPFASKVTTGISFDVVETILPRIIGRDPEFITAAVEPEDIPAETVAKIVIESQYNNPKLAILGEPIYLKLQKLVKESLIIGTSVGRAFWRREKVKRSFYRARIKGSQKVGEIDDIVDFCKKYNFDTSKIEFVKEVKDTPFLDDFDLRHLPFFFFYPDPMFSEAGRMRYKIERDFYSFDELVSEAEIFGYDKNVMKEIAKEEKGGFTFSISKSWLYRYNQLFNSLNPQSFETDDSKIHLLIVDKMWSNGRVYVFVNEKYCLTPQGIPSPYDLLRDPFIFTFNVTTPHSFFGRSEIDAIKKLEDAINDLINMRNDNLFQAMASIWLYNPNIFEEGESFAPYPNSIYPVRDVMAALREIRGQDVTASVYKETSELYNYIQRISGVTDYVKGAEGISLAGRTYGGLRLAQEVANVRFLIKSTLFEQVTLRSLGYFILEMARQFINSDRVVRLVGEKSLEMDSQFYKISAAELKKIKGYMDVQVIPSSTRAVDEQAEAMKLNGLVDRIGAGRPPFDRMTPELYERLLLKYLPLFGFRDAIYWIRKIRENTKASEKMKEELLGAQEKNKRKKSLLPVGREEIMTSSGIQSQPSPLEQILANQVGIPPISEEIANVSQLNRQPIEKLII